MTELLVLAAAVLVVVALSAAFAAKKKRSGGSVGMPYQPVTALFSAAERSFLGVLDGAVGTDYRVFGKVRVADVANLKPGLSNSVRQAALNKVAAKHFDFLVCRAGDLSVVCAVELNDKSHSSPRGKARDVFLGQVCKAIGLPLLTVQAKRTYSAQEVQAQFASIMSGAQPPGAARSTKQPHQVGHDAS